MVSDISFYVIKEAVYNYLTYLDCSLVHSESILLLCKSLVLQPVSRLISSDTQSFRKGLNEIKSFDDIPLLHWKFLTSRPERKGTSRNL